MYFGYAIDVRSAGRNFSNHDPAQPITRSQTQPNIPQGRDENNVSPVSFSAQRRPVSPMSHARGASSAAAGNSSFASSQRQGFNPLNGSSPIRRMNAVRRPSTSSRRNAPHPGLVDAHVNRNNTVLPIREERKKRAQTFDASLGR